MTPATPRQIAAWLRRIIPRGADEADRIAATIAALEADNRRERQ